MTGDLSGPVCDRRRRAIHLIAGGVLFFEMHRKKLAKPRNMHLPEESVYSFRFLSPKARRKKNSGLAAPAIGR